uniref:Uncharacterized protein n=1 Tax=Arundo donax TaxID=35708 RepID=A0A0A9G9C7_ARUDO
MFLFWSSDALLLLQAEEQRSVVCEVLLVVLAQEAGLLIVIPFS